MKSLKSKKRNKLAGIYQRRTRKYKTQKTPIINDKGLMQCTRWKPTHKRV